ncbi:hypothetical protein R1flu_024765 [Riccia fluitans]|uniref:EF-hand domain-containing protein n=1 Tax=Riccia fluitans TaxID=41844 RepID=A0ABD1XVU2_9MARC
MDQWMQQRGGAASQQTALSHLSQQQPQQAHQQQAQYVYSSNSYTGQQGAALSSAASAAYVQQQQQSYTQQAYGQQNYAQQVQQQQQPQQQPPAVAAAQYGGLSTYSAVVGPTQQQSAQPQAVPWSQQASAQTAQPSDQQQSAYGRSTTGVASAASGGGSSMGAGQYGGQYGSVYGAAAQSSTQQLLGPSGRGVASPDFQAQGAAGSRGSAAYGTAQDRAMNTAASYVVAGAASVSASGVYGADAAKYDDTDKYGAGASSASYDGKGGDYGAGSSPSTYTPQKAADQYGANYSIKTPDYSHSERGQYGHSQAAYGQAESPAAVGARRYQDSHSPVVVLQAQQRQQQQHQQQDRQDAQSQILRQQQALQAQQAQATAVLLNRGAASSVLDAGGRNQAEYLAASRNVPPRVAGVQEYGGQVRGLLGQTYGAGRSETDPGLLVSQYGVAGGRSTGTAGTNTGYGAQQQQAAMYGGLTAGRGIQGQMYPHNPPAVGYGGVQLPPGREYSAGRGTGGGGYIAGGSRSDRPSIGSSRFEDRRDDRGTPRRDGLRDDRRGGRDRDRDRARGVNRDRERDRERERREEQRKRERSPVRPVRDHKELPPSKREDRSTRKESPRRDQPHRVASPVKEKRREYLCKVEPFLFGEAERDYNSLCRRYSKLFVVPEFAKLVVCWTGKESQIRLDQPISFEHDAVDVEDEGESKQAPPKSSDKVLPSSATNSTKGPTTWNAKVMLMTGASEGALNELLSDECSDDKPIHLHNLLKFVALRKDRSAIMAAGGVWDKELDGGDPAVDEEVLIRTAVRCTKQATQLDLSGCSNWIRFLEVHYERTGEDGLSSHREVTVIFLPDLSKCLPSLGDWQLQCTQLRQSKLEREGQAKGDKEANPPENKLPVKEGESNGDVKDGEVEVHDESKEKEGNKEKEVQAKDDIKEEEVQGKEKVIEVKPEDLPQQSGFVLTTQRTKTTKMRSMTISLDGLLDYDDDDREECTFELSVFAEIFQEMLQYKMGSLIYSDLELLRETTYARRKDEKKRGRSEGREEASKEVEGEGSTSRKRSKFSDTAGIPEPKTEVVKTEPIQELKAESVPESHVNTVTEPKLEDAPDGRIEIEANDILNANSEEELRKLQARREEAASELEKGKAEGNGGKTEENGMPHTEERKDDGLSTEGESAKLGKDSSVGDEMEVAITTASSDVDMKEAAPSKDRGLEDKLDEKKVDKKHVMNRDVLQAYRYFDRNRVGFLKADDLRRILHGLGKFLSQRNVKDLVACAVSESCKSREERIVYRSFTEKDALVE